MPLDDLALEGVSGARMVSTATNVESRPNIWATKERPNHPEAVQIRPIRTGTRPVECHRNYFSTGGIGKRHRDKAGMCVLTQEYSMARASKARLARAGLQQMGYFLRSEWAVAPG